MTTTATFPAGQREERAQRIAAAWGYRMFRDNCYLHLGHDEHGNPIERQLNHYAVDGNMDATHNSARMALAESEDLEQVLAWVLDGCDQEALDLAWEYFRGGGSDDDWKPFVA